MFLSKSPSGIYYVYYDKENGNPTRISTKTRQRSEANKFFSEFRERLRQRQLNGFNPIDLKAFSFEYLKHSESIHKPKTTKQIKTILKSLTNFTNNIKLQDISEEIITLYLQTKVKVSVFTAQKHLAYLRSTFNYAKIRHYLFSNPCTGIRNFRLPEKLSLFFTEADFQLLLNVIPNKDLKDLIIFATYTGLRQMEILTLQWNQVDFRNRLVILDNQNYITKSKKIRTIPLSLTALQVLTDRELQRNSELVFTLNHKPILQDYISHKFKEYVKLAKLNPTLKFHSLRHTFASWLVQRGTNINLVQELLGHSDIKVTEIYCHLRPDDLRASIERLDGSNMHLD